MATRKQRRTAAAWFKVAFGGNGKKRGKDDALDSYAHPDKEIWADPGGSEDF